MSEQYFSLTFETDKEGGVANQLSFIQGMLARLPEIGKTYAPAAYPDVKMQVRKLSISCLRTLEKDADLDHSFIECVYREDSKKEDILCFTQEEWLEQQFAQAK